MGMLQDGLDRAVQGVFTRPIPKSAQARMRYLVKALKGPHAAAEALGISRRTVERYDRGRSSSPARTSPPGWNAK
ncbi:hypothetical protein SAMN05216252_1269 [Actinacidiphila glaucinigra]|uniref:Helix-turn-helix domain-containing protein n=1 Tax=Actinacidiphila glaucinigra TaxID=235986 RepID=A0A239MPE6_9ACTN|nr:hypothetical protein SAMN05216252_1269 [Actinacidiphila glaucinigra]